MPTKEQLRRIRWFSNGQWQYQPHLYFMANKLSSTEIGDKVEKMEHGGVIDIAGDFFKMEAVHVG